jgi:hypothetical protein
MVELLTELKPDAGSRIAHAHAHLAIIEQPAVTLQPLLLSFDIILNITFSSYDASYVL